MSRQEGSAARTVLAVVFALAAGLALGISGTLYWLRAPAPRAAHVESGLPPPPAIVPSVATSPGPSPDATVEPSTPPTSDATPDPSAPAPPSTVRTARATRPARPETRSAPPSLSTPAPPAASPSPTVARRFVQGATSVESLRPVGAELRGFDTAEVGVKRAPAVNGRLELEMNPERVIPGQPYVVSVFLVNDGKKPIELGGMKAATLVDGKWVQVPLTPENDVVPPGQRALLRELPGTWKQSVGSWSVEVEVTSKRQDVYRNRLTWK